jgi:hypothetical protein
MESVVTVTSPNYWVSYHTGWDADQHFVGGCILEVSHGNASGQTTHILSRPFKSQDEAKLFALHRGYIRKK